MNEQKKQVVLHNIVLPDRLEEALEYYEPYVRHCVNNKITPYKIQPYICFIEKNVKDYYTMQDYISLMGINKFGELIKKEMSFYDDVVPKELLTNPK